MIIGDKERIHFRAPKRLMHEIRKELSLKHKTVRKGILTTAYIQGLYFLLAQLRAERIHMQNAKPIEHFDAKTFANRQALQLRKQIIEYMIDTGKWEEARPYIYVPHLDEAISMIRKKSTSARGDKRMVRNWKVRLREARVIRDSGGTNTLLFCDPMAEEMAEDVATTAAENTIAHSHWDQIDDTMLDEDGKQALANLQRRLEKQVKNKN
jgi:hypothetical protein